MHPGVISRDDGQTIRPDVASVPTSHNALKASPVCFDSLAAHDVYHRHREEHDAQRG
jgi:hypothetical protein